MRAIDILIDLGHSKLARPFVEQLAAMKLDLAAKALPDSLEPALLRAEVLAARGEEAEAEKLLQDLKGNKPDRVELWTALAVLAERRKDRPRGLARDTAVGTRAVSSDAGDLPATVTAIDGREAVVAPPAARPSSPRRAHGVRPGPRAWRV